MNENEIFHETDCVTYSSKKLINTFKKSDSKCESEPPDETALKRLQFIKYVDESCNTSQACREQKTNRRQYYRWKDRYNNFGIRGLYKRHHETHGEKITKKNKYETIVLKIAMENPNAGVNNLSKRCSDIGVKISPTTIHKILESKGLTNTKSRIYKLESQYHGEKFELSDSTLSTIEKYDSRFKDRLIRANRPSEVFIQETRYIGFHLGRAKLYVQIAIDVYSQMAFAHLHKHRSVYDAIDFLKRDIFSSIAIHGPIREIITPNSRIYSKDRNRLYARFLSEKNIGHRYYNEIDAGFQSGAIEKTIKTVKDFVDTQIHTTYGLNLNEIRDCVQECLSQYNSQPILGYPNFGRTPHRVFSVHLSKKSF